MRNMSTIPIYAKTARKGTIIAGTLEPQDDNSRLFVKEVVRSKHFMRVVAGYGIQEDVYLGYIKGRRGWVVIGEQDTKHVLISPMYIWEEKGKTMTFQEDDGAQRFLSEKYMATLDDAAYMKKYIADNPLPEVKPVQDELIRF